MKNKTKVKLLSVPIAGLLAFVGGPVAQADTQESVFADSDPLVVAIQGSGRWVDHRASIKRADREKAEMAVMETRESKTETMETEKRQPTGWQGRRHDSRRY